VLSRAVGVSVRAQRALLCRFEAKRPITVLNAFNRKTNVGRAVVIWASGTMIEPFGDHTERESKSTFSQTERREHGRQGKQRQGQTGATETGKAQPKGKTKSEERQEKHVDLIGNRVNNLRLGESILLGREPLHRQPIEGLYTDAIALISKSSSRRSSLRGHGVRSLSPHLARFHGVKHQGLTTVKAFLRRFSPSGITHVYFSLNARPGSNEKQTQNRTAPFRRMERI
jgi:hypothetical protein